MHRMIQNNNTFPGLWSRVRDSPTDNTDRQEKVEANHGQQVF